MLNHARRPVRGPARGTGYARELGFETRRLRNKAYLPCRLRFAFGSPPDRGDMDQESRYGRGGEAERAEIVSSRPVPREEALCTP